MVLDDTKPVPEQHFAMGLVWSFCSSSRFLRDAPHCAQRLGRGHDPRCTDVVEVVDVEGVWTASINMSVLNPSL